MKEQYISPELNIVLFAPVEKVASEFLELDTSMVEWNRITEFYSAGDGASWNDGDIFLPL